jgi:hypothetical protein
LALSLCCCAAFSASQPPASKLPTLREVIFDAIRDGANAEHFVPIRGQEADMLRASSGSSGTVYGYAKVTHRFHKAGCARLNVGIAQDGMMKTPDPKRFKGAMIPWQMNMCLDGTPPAEGMDMSKLPPAYFRSQP